MTDKMRPAPTRDARKPHVEWAIGVDPGVTTGLAMVWRNHNTDKWKVYAVKQVDSREYGEWQSAAMCSGQIASWAGLIPHHYDNLFRGVVIEDFVLRRQEMDRTLLSPVRMINLIISHLALYDSESYVSDNRPGQPLAIVSLNLTVPQWPYEDDTSPIPRTMYAPLYCQQPAQAKTTFTDERLRHYSLYTPTRGKQHARDAVRHAATLLLRDKVPNLNSPKAKKTQSNHPPHLPPPPKS
jgi:hypothetical protein